jgi:hypothetical protein
VWYGYNLQVALCVSVEAVGFEFLGMSLRSLRLRYVAGFSNIPPLFSVNIIQDNVSVYWHNVLRFLQIAYIFMGLLYFLGKVSLWAYNVS